MNDNQIKFKIATEFTEYPGPRYKYQGEYSGEKFFEEVLDGQMQDAIDKDVKLEIDLDGTAGYASSFLDEAVGNLVKKYGGEIIEQRLRIISVLEPDWIDMIYKETIPEWEKKRIGKL